MLCRKLSVVCLLALTACCLPAMGASTQTVTLAWNPSTSTAVAGYRLYTGATSRNYTNMVELGKATSVTVSNLAQGVTYYFAVTAYDLIGLESSYSGEITYTVPLLTPFQSWRYSYFGSSSNSGLAADSASPADDGVPNLVKYALGLNPFTKANPDQEITGGIQLLNGQRYLTLTVNRAAKASGVTYLVQVCGSTNAWTSGSPSTVTLSDTATQLVVRDATPIGIANSRCIRLAVSDP